MSRLVDPPDADSAAIGARGHDGPDPRACMRLGRAVETRRAQAGRGTLASHGSAAALSLAHKITCPPLIRKRQRTAQHSRRSGCEDCARNLSRYMY